MTADTAATTTVAATSEYFEKAKAALKAERDAMIQQIRDELAASKRKALSKV